VYAFTDQGVVAYSDAGGVSVVSRAIEDDLLRVSSDLFPAFSDIAHAIPYESARRLLVAVPDATSDTTPTKLWVYNAFTQTWTHWALPSTAGFVSPSDDKLFLLDPDLNTARRERKTFSAADFADLEYDTSITASDGSTTISVSDTSDYAVGYLVKQEFREGVIVEIVDGTDLVLDVALTWDLSDATVFQPITSTITWHPITAGDPGMMKHWQDLTAFFRNPNVREITAKFATDFRPLTVDLTITPRDLQGGWGEAPWGELPWGVPQRGEQVVRTLVPRERARSHWLLFTLVVEDVFGNYQLNGFSVRYEGMSTRYQ